MGDDTKGNSDFGDDLNVLAGVLGVVSFALLATALLV